MTCEKCGYTLNEGAKFCNNCGAAVNGAPASAPQSNPFDDVPAAGVGKRKGLGLVIGIGVAALAAVVVLVILVSSLFGGAKATVLKAMAKSAGEYAEVLDTFGMSTIKKLGEKQAYTQKIDLELDTLDGSREMRGLGMSLVAATDIPGRPMKQSSKPVRATQKP